MQNQNQVPAKNPGMPDKSFQAMQQFMNAQPQSNSQQQNQPQQANFQPVAGQGQPQQQAPTAFQQQTADQPVGNEFANKYAEMQKQNKELNKQLAQLKKEQQDKVEGLTNSKAEAAVTDVLSGYEKTFKQHYQFAVLNGPDIEFDVELRPLYAMDFQTIQNRVVEDTNGYNRFYDAENKRIVESVECLNVAAIDVPSEYLSLDKLIRTDIPIMIYEDYMTWLETFRLSERA